jgi:hypothetical protein
MSGPFTNAEANTAIDQAVTGLPVESHDAWDDLAASLIGKRLSSAAGTVDYDYSESAVKFQVGGTVTNANDVVGWNNQKPHGVCEDCVFKLHIHWEQDFDGVLSPTWTYQYRVQDNGGMKTTAWTTVSVTSAAGNEVFDRPTATGEVVNQITMLGDIDTSASPLSSTVQFRLTRSDSTTGDVLATFVDSHVNYDQRGSRQEYVK